MGPGNFREGTSAQEGQRGEAAGALCACTVVRLRRALTARLSLDLNLEVSNSTGTPSFQMEGCHAVFNGCQDSGLFEVTEHLLVDEAQVSSDSKVALEANHRKQM